MTVPSVPTLVVQISEVLTERGPGNVEQIVSGILDRYSYLPNIGSLRMAMFYLHRDGKIIRTGRGVYGLPGQAAPASGSPAGFKLDAWVAAQVHKAYPGMVTPASLKRTLCRERKAMLPLASFEASLGRLIASGEAEGSATGKTMWCPMPEAPDIFA